MSRGLLHSPISSGTAANRPTDFPGDYDVAYYWATDTATMFVASKPDVGASQTAAWRSIGNSPVELTDANASILPANSGRPHLIPNVTADRTFTLPAVADAVGCMFSFIAEVGAADGHDWIFATAAADELYAGGVLSVDTDAGPATVAAVVADQSDDNALQVNLPQGGTRVDMYCDGAQWVVSGTVVSAAAPAFS